MAPLDAPTRARPPVAGSELARPSNWSGSPASSATLEAIGVPAQVALQPSRTLEGVRDAAQQLGGIARDGGHGRSLGAARGYSPPNPAMS